MKAWGETGSISSDWKKKLAELIFNFLINFFSSDHWSAVAAASGRQRPPVSLGRRFSDFEKRRKRGRHVGRRSQRRQQVGVAKNLATISLDTNLHFFSSATN